MLRPKPMVFDGRKAIPALDAALKGRGSAQLSHFLANRLDFAERKRLSKLVGDARAKQAADAMPEDADFEAVAAAIVSKIGAGAVGKLVAALQAAAQKPAQGQRQEGPANPFTASVAAQDAAARISLDNFGERPPPKRLPKKTAAAAEDFARRWPQVDRVGNR